MGKLKQLRNSLLVQWLDKLLNGRRYFEQLIEYGPLPMQPDVAGPFDKVCEMSAKSDVLAKAEVLRPFLEQRTRHRFGLLFLHNGRSRGDLLPLDILSLDISTFLTELPMAAQKWNYISQTPLQPSGSLRQVE